MKTKHIPPKKEFEILRVPPDKKSLKKAYEMIKASLDISLSFEEFYIHTHSCYVIEKNNEYIGFGTLNTIRETPRRMYEMNIITFDDEDNYAKLYDTIQTVIAAHRDGDIIVKNLNDEEYYSNLISALKNNKFKLKIDKDGNKNYILEVGSRVYSSNKDMRPINFYDKTEVIDKIVKLDDYNENSDIEQSQEAYRQKIIEEQEPIIYNNDYCEQQEGEQRLSDFLPSDIPPCCPRLNEI